MAVTSVIESQRVTEQQGCMHVPRAGPGVSKMTQKQR